MTSSRLPGKVLAEAEGAPMLELMIERLRFVSEIDHIVVATTVNASDDPIEALATKLGVGCWRGSEDDVLQRVLDAARGAAADVIVELTGDCPLIDPRVVAQTIAAYRASGADYVANVPTRTYPLGMETQVFATKVLEDVARRTSDPVDHEHVSLFIYRNPSLYSLVNLTAPQELTRPELRLTLDTPADLAVIRAVFAALRPTRRDFSLADILRYADAHPEIAAINSAVPHRYV
jgi:spore coat polysaccharide biosynthesis protein SpsF